MKHVDLWLTLDMERSVDQAIVRVPRLDNWRRIMVRLRVGDAPYELPAGATAAWSLDRFGEGVPLNEIAATVSTMEVEGSDETEQVIVLQWDAAWTQISGAFRAIIHIVGSDQEDLWTPTFQFIVTESPYDDATVRQSPQFTALAQLKDALEEQLEEMEEVYGDVSLAVGRAEAAAVGAEASATTATNAKADANAYRQQAMNYANTASSAAGQAVSAKNSAEAAATEAGGAAEDAEAWAVGEKGGEAVPSTDPTYHNNAKYYAEQAELTTQTVKYVEQELTNEQKTTARNNINAASTDGTYKEFTAGNAEQLISSVGVVDKVPYSFRTSGGSESIGNRLNDKIVGGSIIWNQRKNIVSGTTTAPSFTVYSTTNTAKTNTDTYTRATVKVNKTGYAGGMYATFSAIAGGHRLLIKYKARSNKNVTVGITYGGSANYLTTTLTAGEWKERWGIMAMASSESRMWFSYTTALEVDDYVDWSEIMVFDLTQMFGSEIADYLYSLRSETGNPGVVWFRNLFTKPYYQYNGGELMSVCTKAHVTRGFNAYNHDTQEAPLIGNKKYQITGAYTSLSYSTGETITPDENGEFTPSDSGILTVTGGDSASTCVHLVWNGSHNGEHAPYIEHYYPLSAIELRGIPKLDNDDNLYFDGDTYEHDGTVTRKYEYRAYQSGDESLPDAITDGTHTVVKLLAHTTETANPFEDPQIVDDFGTEEYVDALATAETSPRDVSVPVGHDTFYQANLRDKLQNLPDNANADGDYIVRQSGSKQSLVPFDTSDISDNFELILKDLRSIPSDYALIEYIENDGDLLYYTGITTASGDELEIDCRLSWVDGGIVSGFNSGTGKIVSINTGTTADCYFGSSLGSGYLDGYKGKIVDVIFNNTRLEANGTTLLEYSNTIGTAGYQLAIFGRTGSNRYHAPSGTRFFRYFVTQNRVSAFRGYTVKRRSDGVVGFYDVVGKAFKVNYATYATGTPIAGPEVDVDLYSLYAKQVLLQDTIDGIENSIESVTGNTPQALNRDMEAAVFAAVGRNTIISSDPTPSSYTLGKKNFSFAVISDIHSTTQNESSMYHVPRFVEYCNANKDNLDCAVCLGDIVRKEPSETETIAAIMGHFNKLEIPFLYVVGNHDAGYTGNRGLEETTAKELYFADIIAKGWIQDSDFGGENACYWHKDFDDYKVRVIGLYEYEALDADTSSAPEVASRRWFDTEELQWFADTLYATPDGYSVVLLTHQILDGNITVKNCLFTQKTGFDLQSSIESGNAFMNAVEGNPIGDIIKAFETSGAINQTYYPISRYSSALAGRSATVAKDFSGRTENGKFVCQFCGHTHSSQVITYTGENADQMCVICPSGSINAYQQSWSDMRVSTSNRNFDRFYVVGIDTKYKFVNLVAIGAQDTIDGQTRDKISLPYA